MLPVAGSTWVFDPFGVFDSLNVTEKLTPDSTADVALNSAVKVRVWFRARLPKSQTSGALVVGAQLPASWPIALAYVRPPVGVASVTTTWVSVWLSVFFTMTFVAVTPPTVTGVSVSWPFVASPTGPDPR
jgi:hypothetical protein